MKPYRECVVAVIVNEEGAVFSGERADRPGIWQLPQGGVDEGEIPEDAVLRELREEIGSDEVEILKVLPDKISYEFPDSLKAAIAQKYRGQTQTWFLMRFKEGASPSIEKSDKEFAALSWRKPDDLLAGIVSWKEEAYKLGLSALNLIEGA